MGQERATISHIEGATGRMECISASYRAHRFIPHFHETYVVGVVTSGAARTRYRGADVVLRPGSVFVIEPGEVHAGESAEDEGFSYRAFYPSVDDMRVAGVVGGRPRFARLGYADAELASRVAAMHEAATSGACSGADVAVLLAELVRRFGDTGSALTCHGHRAVRIAREHVEQNYAHRVPLATLSEVSGMSTFHLIRVFRREVGLPPGMYLHLVRIRHATEMLRAGEPISHVAYASGFSDQSHLTRRFRRIMGVTPGEYARRNRAA
ncbi:MAG: AraC family transcriptional regulator [Gemmatimonadaceae bacterium]